MTEKERQIAQAFRANPGKRQRDIAALLGVNVATIRHALIRIRREGKNDWEKKRQPPAPPPQPAGQVTVSVQKASSARVDPDRTTVAITLPRLRFVEKPYEPEQPRRRIITPVPKLSPLDEMKARRLLLLKKINREGLARGKFRTRSG